MKLSNAASRILLADRENILDALDIFRPTEPQEPFLRNFSNPEGMEYLVGGGNRCLAGSQEIYDPVLGKRRRVDEIDSDFHVYSRDPNTGERIVAVARRPYIKGYDLLCRVSLSNGETIRISPEHRFLGCNGDWVRFSLVNPIGLASGGLSGFNRDFDCDGFHCSDIVNTGDIEESWEGFVWDFEVPETGNYECAGVISHNSGKSTICSAVTSSIIRNKPLTMRDGTKINLKKELWNNDPLKVWIIGYDWNHIAANCYRFLFRSNMFKIIRDKKTGQWRAYDPGKDDERLAKPSSPFIRMSDVKGGMNGIAWEDKKMGAIKAFETNDGSRIEFYASTGARPQGSAVHLIWIDERIDDPQFFSELHARLWDYKGKILWSSWPDVQPVQSLIDLEQRATEQLGTDNPRAYAVKLKGSENPYIVSAMRDYSLSTMDEDMRKARDEGVLNMERWKTYSLFSPYIHRVLKPASTPEEAAKVDDNLAKVVREKNQIPEDWTRYLVLDPGHQNAAVLFVAVPPPKLGDFIVPYDELYIHNKDAKYLAEMVAEKTKGQYFEDFIIDAHAARQTPMGFDRRIGENYEREFERCKLACRRRGSRFSYGSDNVEGRILRLQSSMNIRADGTTRLRIMVDRCPELVKQLQQYKWGVDPKGNPTDRPALHQKIDVAVSCEYFVSRDDCVWVKPPNIRKESITPSSIAANLATILGIKKKRTEESVNCGVPN